MLSRPPQLVEDQLEVSVLGSPQILQNGGAPKVMPSAKARALLYYLAVEGRAFARDEMAEMFWGDNTTDPRKSLRVDLVALNKMLGDRLAVEKKSLALRLERGVVVDVREYLELIRRGGDSLEEAMALYRGDFLEGFQPGQTSAEFEHWLLRWRERLRAQHFDLLARLARQEMAQQRWALALERIAAALNLTPLDLEANRIAILCYGQMGDLARARAHLVQFETAWRSDMGDEPPTEIASALVQIESGGALIPNQPVPIAIQWGIFQPTTLPRHHCVRPQLVAEIENALIEDADLCAILALVGTGGAGKSTLAIHAAHKLQARFPDGVLWGNATNSSPSALIEGWSQSLGFDFSRLSDLESRAAAWRGALSRRKVLLVLDNIVSADGLELLFPASAGSAVLLTTRDREAAVALNAREIVVGELDIPTRRLLLEKILTPERVARERAAADRLGALVQGLPLALEILAKRLYYAPAERIADLVARLEAMERKLDLLEHGPQNVRACIALSWEPLNTALRGAFATAGVFEGHSFTVDALAHLLQIDRYRAGDLLVGMLQRSLLSAVESGRYVQHALVAEFALEKLGEVDTITQRFIAFFTALARFRRREHTRLEDEWGMLRRTAELLARDARDDELLDLVENMTDMLFGKGRFSEIRATSLLAQPAALRGENGSQIGRIALHHARACVEQGDYDEAWTLLIQSENAARFSDDNDLLGDVLLTRGRVCLERYDVQGTLENAESARKIKEMAGDMEGVAQTLYLMAAIPYTRADYDSAFQMATEALKIQRQYGGAIGAIQIMRFLIDVCVGRKHFEIAYQYGMEALALCDQIEDRCERAPVLYSLALVTQRQPAPDLPRAREYAAQSIDLFARMGDRASLARAHYRKGMIALDQGDLVLAQSASEEAATIMRQMGTTWDLVYILKFMGRIAKSDRNPALAERYFREGLDLALTLEQHPMVRSLEEEIGAVNALEKSA